MNTSVKFLICMLLVSMMGEVAFPAVAYVPFRERVQGADIVVLGVVEGEVALDSSESPGPSGGVPQFRYCKESSVRVIRCYKGAVSAGKNVEVLSDSTFMCNTSHLVSGKSYILMLSKSHEGDYRIVAAGQGQWEVAELDGRFRVMDGVGSLYGGDPLPVFESWIEEALAGPAPDLPETIKTPKVALEKARARVDSLNIDLSEFGQASVKRKDENASFPELPGFCDPEDPVWIVRWEHLQAEKMPRSYWWNHVEGWVHAETGEVRILGRPCAGEPLEPGELMEITAQVAVTAASPAVRPISREEFEESAPRVLRDRGVVWWERKMPAIPPNASFFEIESPFPEHPEFERMVYLLDDVPRIVFSGSIRSAADRGSARERRDQWVKERRSRR